MDKRNKTMQGMSRGKVQPRWRRSRSCAQTKESKTTLYLQHTDYDTCDPGNCTPTHTVAHLSRIPAPASAPPCSPYSLFPLPSAAHMARLDLDPETLEAFLGFLCASLGLAWLSRVSPRGVAQVSACQVRSFCLSFLFFLSLFFFSFCILLPATVGDTVDTVFRVQQLSPGLVAAPPRRLSFLLPIGAQNSGGSTGTSSCRSVSPTPYIHTPYGLPFSNLPV